jgi:hypothetical protein
MISLASNGRLITGMTPERLRRVLSALYLPQERSQEQHKPAKVPERA